jgi:putative flippase GtrA
MKLKLVRYFFAGGAAAAIDFAIFFFAVKGLGYPWFSVAIFSFVVATIANYLLSIRFVFESRVRFRRREEVALVFMVSAVAMALNQAILWLAIDLLTLNLLISKVAATGTVFLFNFGCRHYFIFSQRPEGKPMPSISRSPER